MHVSSMAYVGKGAKWVKGGFWCFEVANGVGYGMFFTWK